MNAHLQTIWRKDPATLTDAEHALLLDADQGLPELDSEDEAWLASGEGRAARQSAERAADAVRRAWLGDVDDRHVLEAAHARLGASAALVEVRWRGRTGLPELSSGGVGGRFRLGHGSGTVSVGARGARLRLACVGRQLRARTRGESLLVEVRGADGALPARFERQGVPLWTFELAPPAPVWLLAWSVTPATAAKRLDVALDALDEALWAEVVEGVCALLRGELARVDLSGWYADWARHPSGKRGLTLASGCRLVELAAGTPPVPARGGAVARRYRRMR